jgi:signal peptidase I
MKRPPIILSFLLVLIAAGCSPLLKIQPVKVEGTAMLPALSDGDRIIVERDFDKLERGDIVLFYNPDDHRGRYIKRVIGLPNEVIEIREGTVMINGVTLPEPYIESRLNLAHRSTDKIQLPADRYFVMGDNRDNSADSRIFGPIDRQLIYARYMRKYYNAGP